MDDPIVIDPTDQEDRMDGVETESESINITNRSYDVGRSEYAIGLSRYRGYFSRALSSTISPQPEPKTKEIMRSHFKITKQRSRSPAKNRTSKFHKLSNNTTDSNVNKLSPTVYEVSDEEEDFGNGSQQYQDHLSRQRYHERELLAKREANEFVTINDTDSTDSTDTDIEGEKVPDSAAYSNPPVILIDDEENDIEFVRSVERRQHSSCATVKELKSYRVRNGTCTAGKCVELLDGSFMRVAKITKSTSDIVSITGQLFMRHNDFKDKAKWPRRTNEVVWVSTVKDGRSSDHVTRPIEQVTRIRCLILTNQSFPMTSIRDYPDAQRDMAYNKEHGPIFCRWKHTLVIDEAGKTLQESIEKLSQEAADPIGRAHHTQVRYCWRGRHTTPGGEHVFAMNSISENGYTTKQARQYTLGDTFCGGGGVSCGADQAGLFIKFGVDIHENAMKTYRLNFANKGTECLCQDIHDFIQNTCGRIGFVDILHISPPCQPFSPAHTVPNILRDEMNQASLFAVGELLKQLKPRAVTLEETYGLLNRHQQWFHALIKMFLDCGYSIRWTGARLEEYGLPQKRRRLLIVAAGPGEALPPFPEITHSEKDNNYPRLVTIQDSIKDIPTGASVSHHDIQAARYEPANYRASYDPHTQAKTITTSGGIGNYHPSGKRGFSIREYSALQRFPLNFRFADVRVTELRRQIGNAVPPFVIKKLYREIIKSLKKTDGVL